MITPHAGELGRLLGTPSAEVDAHRLACAREAAARSEAIVVLKGDDSIVAAPDGRAAVSRGGAPALATAGTGDVLSGVIGAYLSKRMDPFAAACAGVFVHARAGRLAAETIAERASSPAMWSPCCREREPPRGTVRDVALRALARVNLGRDGAQRRLAALRLAGGAQLCAVVKADASGHGAVPVARAALAGGATGLAVARSGRRRSCARAGSRPGAHARRDQRGRAAGRAGRPGRGGRLDRTVRRVAAQIRRAVPASAGAACT